jgi:hypothetical protein
MGCPPTHAQRWQLLARYSRYPLDSSRSSLEPAADEPKEQPSKKEAKEIEETQKFQNPKLASKKIVLKFTRNVLRCTNSRCKATFWNREVNAARNILELLSARLLSFERIPPFARSCPAVKATWAARDP